MPVTNLFIGSPVDAARTPERLFRALMIEDWAEHDSDNYPQGSYHLGRGGDVELTLWADEFAGFEDYPYRLALSLINDSQFDLEAVTDLAVAELLKGGFSVARETGNGTGFVERELYSLSPSGQILKRPDRREVAEE